MAMEGAAERGGGRGGGGERGETSRALYSAAVALQRSANLCSDIIVPVPAVTPLTQGAVLCACLALCRTASTIHHM